MCRSFLTSVIELRIYVLLDHPSRQRRERRWLSYSSGFRMLALFMPVPQVCCHHLCNASTFYSLTCCCRFSKLTWLNVSRYACLCIFIHLLAFWTCWDVFNTTVSNYWRVQYWNNVSFRILSTVDIVSMHLFILPASLVYPDRICYFLDWPKK